MRRIWTSVLSAIAAIAVVAAAYGQNFQADSSLSAYSVIWPANATAVQICAPSCRIYQIDVFNNGASLAYLNIYNSATATCGSGTPQWRGMISYGSSSSGGGFTLPAVNGDSYSLGAWACIHTVIGDTDATAPSASQFLLNIHYKRVDQHG